MQRSWLLAALVALALAAVSACDDDPAAPADTTGTLRGTLVRAADGTPFGPLTIELFDLERLAVVDRTTADSAGVFVFAGITDGTYLPVLVSDAVAPFGLPRARYAFDDGETYDDVFLVAPLPGGLTPDDEGVAGTVIDGATGDPIPFARVEMNGPTGGSSWFQGSSNASEFRGHATLLETSADAAGMFRIVPVPLVLVPTATDPPSFDVRVPSYRVVAPGYRARNMTAAPPLGTVREVTIRLDRGVDDGRIRGRIVGRDGEPRAGVRVVAEWRRGAGEMFRGGTGTGTPGDVAPAVLIGLDGVSDPDGRFEIGGLPDGAYNLFAGARPDDGWVDLTGIQGRDLVDSLDVGDIEVAPAIAFVDLQPSYTIGDTLRWTPVDGATVYRIRARSAQSLGSASDRPTAPVSVFDSSEAPFDVDAAFLLDIQAFDGESNLISTTDRPRAIQWRADPGTGGGL